MGPLWTELREAFSLELSEGIIPEALEKLMIGEGQAKTILVNGVHVQSLDHQLKVVIPRAGHVSRLEYPETFNQELDDFPEGLVLSTN